MNVKGLVMITRTGLLVTDPVKVAVCGLFGALVASVTMAVEVRGIVPLFRGA